MSKLPETRPESPETETSAKASDRFFTKRRAVTAAVALTVSAALGYGAKELGGRLIEDKIEEIQKDASELDIAEVLANLESSDG